MSGENSAGRDEARIRINLKDYLEALADYNYFSYKAENEKARMDRAIANLRAAGGNTEIERLTHG